MQEIRDGDIAAWELEATETAPRAEATTVEELRREADLTGLWNATRERLRARLSAHNFGMYIEPARVLPGGGDGILRLEYPSQFLADWTRDCYRDRFEEELLAVASVRIPIDFVVATTVEVPVESLATGSSDQFQERASEPSARRLAATGTEGRAPLHVVSDARPAAPVPRSESSAVRQPEAPVRPSPVLGGFESKLSDRFDFGTFVVGNSNKFAVAAAEAVADQPGQSYNPLYIYGGVGLGKTHLMQAAGNRIQRSRSSLRIRYVTGEQFTNELVACIKRNRMQEFRARFRQCDALLIDDVQFIAGKSATQEELFHTFNDLYQDNKQIILTSDATPAELDKLDERLKTRFQWGLVADIQPPEIETRIAILQTKAAEMGLSITPEVVEYIARHVRHNVRELEGSLKRLEAFGGVTDGPLTVDLCKSVLRNLLANRGEQVDIDHVMRACAEHFKVTVAEIRGPVRKQHIVRPRQAAMYLARTLLNASFPQLGEKFEKDHSTVISGVNRVKKLMEEDEDYRKSVESIEQQLMKNL